MAKSSSMLGMDVKMDYFKCFEVENMKMVYMCFFLIGKSENLPLVSVIQIGCILVGVQGQFINGRRLGFAQLQFIANRFGLVVAGQFIVETELNGFFQFGLRSGWYGQLSWLFLFGVLENSSGGSSSLGFFDLTGNTNGLFQLFINGR